MLVGALRTARSGASLFLDAPLSEARISCLVPVIQQNI